MTLPELLGSLGMILGLLAGVVTGIVLGLGWWTVGTGGLGVVLGWITGVLLTTPVMMMLERADKRSKGTEQSAG